MNNQWLLPPPTSTHASIKGRPAISWHSTRAARTDWIIRRLPPGRVQNRPKVNHPPQQEKPQYGRQGKLDKGDQEASL